MKLIGIDSIFIPQNWLTANGVNANVDGNLYNIPLNSPYTPSYVQTALLGSGYSVFGASQIPNCLTVNLNV